MKILYQTVLTGLKGKSSTVSLNNSCCRAFWQTEEVFTYVGRCNFLSELPIYLSNFNHLSPLSIRFQKQTGSSVEWGPHPTTPRSYGTTAPELSRQQGHQPIITHSYNQKSPAASRRQQGVVKSEQAHPLGDGKNPFTGGQK